MPYCRYVDQGFICPCGCTSGNIVCHVFFRYGYCRFGSRCHKSHNVSTPRRSQSTVFDVSSVLDYLDTVDTNIVRMLPDHLLPMPCMHDGINSLRLTCHSMDVFRRWSLTCNLQRQWTWKPFRAAVFLDLGNVLSSLNSQQLEQLLWDLTAESLQGVGVYICTKGRNKWRSLVEEKDLRVFSQGIDGVIINNHAEGCIDEPRPPELNCIQTLPPHFLFVDNADKGDCARLLACPVLLFDDRTTNLHQVYLKALRGSHGVLVETSKNIRHEWLWRTTHLEVDTWIHKVHQWLQSLHC